MDYLLGTPEWPGRQFAQIIDKTKEKGRLFQISKHKWSCLPPRAMLRFLSLNSFIIKYYDGSLLIPGLSAFHNNGNTILTVWQWPRMGDAGSTYLLQTLAPGPAAMASDSNAALAPAPG